MKDDALRLCVEALESFAKSPYIKQHHPKRMKAGLDAAAAAKKAMAEQPSAPVARMLVWRGPYWQTPPPPAARTYAEFPEDRALPANREAYWENGEPLYTRHGAKQ